MTIIEFFDPEMLENISSALLLKPERVVLFGRDEKKLSSFQINMVAILKEKNIDTEVICVPLNTQSYPVLVHQFTEFVTQYPDCVFDITGGEDLVLVAMGAVAVKNNVPMQRINPKLGKVRTIKPNHDEEIQAYTAHLTVSQAISLFGGTLQKQAALYKIKKALFTPEGKKDVTCLWKLLCKNPAHWNSALDVLSSYVDDAFRSKDGLHFFVVTPQKQKTTKEERMDTLLSLLTEKKLLTKKSFGEKTQYRAKNKLILHALSKSGTVLELYTLLCALSVTAKEGVPLLTDAVSGGEIDWEFTKIEADDVQNEIDVLATYGTIPVFISCKNGSVDADELYKLSTVATRFGGKYAKKILVMTSYSVRESFLTRARAMGISVIRNAHTLSFEALTEKLKNAIEN